jgi:hypothetical protein
MAAHRHEDPPLAIISRADCQNPWSFEGMARLVAVVLPLHCDDLLPGLDFMGRLC